MLAVGYPLIGKTSKLESLDSQYDRVKTQIESAKTFAQNPESVEAIGYAAVLEANRVVIKKIIAGDSLADIADGEMKLPSGTTLTLLSSGCSGGAKEVRFYSPSGEQRCTSSTSSKKLSFELAKSGLKKNFIVEDGQIAISSDSGITP